MENLELKPWTLPEQAVTTIQPLRPNENKVHIILMPMSWQNKISHSYKDAR